MLFNFFLRSVVNHGSERLNPLGTQVTKKTE
jgi:hypothetical protein